jgi:hypothetical protein
LHKKRYIFAVFIFKSLPATVYSENIFILALQKKFMEDNLVSDTFLLQVDSGNTSYLKEAARWAKFLAVVGFSLCAIILLVGFFFGSIFSSSFSELSAQTGASSNMESIIVIIYVVIIVILYFFPLLYLYNFSSKMQTALRNNDQISLNTSFKNLKSCFKYMGILTIIVLCVYGLGIIFAMLGFAFLH